ncbi:glucosamine-6-phosphate deaminase [Clostridium botulinum]|uniref:Glucosamine-6-phosphate deaminase n=1 Tax=Clostridium botulinum C/D str. DC5 TaxID=1443128 RepID=A0A0A0IIF8_CLOBO|nr:glucosamine-6-phosphate deaminase [Clostridium botulinum]KEI07509.1 glucosamine-6-phosphate deaminase [Clostridium botulinum C/D str. BKT75002]KEI09877.1 glucosamine-6-phosphate deaminase [Clostridium botulinum C/D str. BKT2873]KGM97594.1 glucosamine-6-phosphate deaminase [Clostridium botulinum D str. CCUG 7971]KGN00723.1 glucosamine-6-phosphate deaminase [Clostridium botulinum C/D str. DC5]KOC50996.1 glucosamine-6-phosphate deaminase [Clostridium botulinum]
MKILVVNNYEEMSKKATEILLSQVTSEPNSVLGLATGGTPLGMYKEIINKYNTDNIDFSKIKTFNLDEYLGLDKKNPKSYYYYMMNNLFKHININLENVHILNGKSTDAIQECKTFEEKIKNCGGIDLQVLGIGVNGHIGFNEPNTHFEPNTHIVTLDNKTIESNSRFFKSKEEVPTKAISMGIKTIMKSKKILLLASGTSKSTAIFETIHGKINPQVPASILQLHNDVTLILDKDASIKI